MQHKNALKILVSALMFSTLSGCNAAVDTPSNTLQSAAVNANQTRLEESSLDDRVSYACLVDARNPSPREFFLVRQVVDTSTGVTKAFDQLLTHVKKEYCLNYIDSGLNINGVVREKNTPWKENIVDEFVCLKDALKEEAMSFYLVRTTRDKARGVVTSILAINQFTELKYCQNQLN